MTQPWHTADHITGDQLDQLYGWLTTARAAARAEQKRAERAEAALNAIRALADELTQRGNRRTGNERVLGRRILAALDTHTTPTETR